MYSPWKIAVFASFLLFFIDFYLSHHLQFVTWPSEVNPVRHRNEVPLLRTVVVNSPSTASSWDEWYTTRLLQSANQYLEPDLFVFLDTEKEIERVIRSSVFSGDSLTAGSVTAVFLSRNEVEILENSGHILVFAGRDVSFGELMGELEVAQVLRNDKEATPGAKPVILFSEKPLFKQSRSPVCRLKYSHDKFWSADETEKLLTKLHPIPFVFTGSDRDGCYFIHSKSGMQGGHDPASLEPPAGEMEDSFVSEVYASEDVGDDESDVHAYEMHKKNLTTSTVELSVRSAAAEYGGVLGMFEIDTFRPGIQWEWHSKHDENVRAYKSKQVMQLVLHHETEAVHHSAELETKDSGRSKTSRPHRRRSHWHDMRSLLLTSFRMPEFVYHFAGAPHVVLETILVFRVAFVFSIVCTALLVLLQCLRGPSKSKTF